MKSFLFKFTAAATLAFSAPCFAVMPPMPGMTSGSGDNGMKHAGIGLSGATLSVSIADPPIAPVTMTSGFGVDYTPNKFDVLEDVHFNAQHGWLPNGFISLPAERAIWIERSGVTQPAGSTFKIYEGGNMTEGMGTWTMNEIYSSNGFKWQWDAAMQHDYYTADQLGNYSLSFNVYVGDLSGVADTNFTPTTAVFEFVVVPEPSALGLVILGAMGLFMKRRLC